MRPWFNGAIAAILIFTLAVAVFATGTGAVELLLWLVLAIAVGGLVVIALKKAEKAPPS